MVKRIEWVLFFLLLPLTLFSQINVTSEIEADSRLENMPLKGVITVTHPKEDEVQQQSFRLGGKPLETELIRSVQLSPTGDLMISIYHFTLPGKPVGLHVLPEVEVLVGNKKQRSIATSYQINPKKQTQQIRPGQIVLGLEAFVDGKSELYPGQRTKLGYRYFFNYNFDLSVEKLPLLDAKGLRRIGGKVTKDFVKNQMNVFEVMQEVEAVKAGTFTYGPSLIEGTAYRVGMFGAKEFAKTISRAEAPAISITVKPFPEEGKPPSFNGAVGNFDIRTKLLSSDKVYVGDKLRLHIVVTGSGDLETVQVPKLCCQPRISGLFKEGDLPPVGEIAGNSKQFEVELRPLTTAAREIPSFEFSFFNPETETYVIRNTEPISILVQPLYGKENVGDKPSVRTDDRQPEWDPGIKPIEIERNYSLKAGDLVARPFGSWWVMLLFPLGLIAMIIQMQVRKFLASREGIVKKKSSADLMKEAVLVKSDPSKFYQLLQEALVQRLVERDELQEKVESLEGLPTTGLAGEVRSFLFGIQERRFSGKEERSTDDLIREAAVLMKKMRG